MSAKHAYFLRFAYLFLAVVGLHCSMWAFSSCRKAQLLSSCGVRASLAAEHRLEVLGLSSRGVWV